MRRTWSKSLGLSVRILCAAAFLCFGIASQAISDERSLSPEEVAAYMLPDGTLPSLCITIPGTDGEGKIVKLGFETIGVGKTVAFVVPDVPLTDTFALTKSRTRPANVPALRHLLYPPGSGPRAPPLTGSLT